MKTIVLKIDQLTVNPDNDRHGPRGSEDSAIHWLLDNKPLQMRNLGKGISEKGRLFDIPLVVAHGDRYLVKDGNRRIASVKLILNPERATAGFIDFYRGLKETGLPLSNEVTCQVEEDGDTADEIVDVRHNGTQDGLGQVQWDVRAKRNYRTRRSKKGDYDWSEAIEGLLVKNGEHELAKAINRSNLDKLLGARKRREALGITHHSPETLATDSKDTHLLKLAKRLARDMSNGSLTLHNVLNSKGKDAYVARLTEDGLERSVPTKNKDSKSFKEEKLPFPEMVIRSPKPRSTLIPASDFEINWTYKQTKIKYLFEELQSYLNFDKHPLAISACLRILIEQICHEYLERFGLPKKEYLAKNFKSCISNLKTVGLIDEKMHHDLTRICDAKDSMVSIENLQRILHSPNQTPQPSDMRSFWDSVQPALIAMLKQEK